jgi:hypothetical protein
MLTALIAFAAEEAGHEETSKTLFYVCGLLLAGWAVVVSAIGIKAHETFPSSKSAARGVMTISAVLVLLAMASAIITS